ncbi:MAG: ABC transporter ATP-binding protein [Candidatus Omnitrophota bacterium]
MISSIKLEGVQKNYLASEFSLKVDKLEFKNTDINIIVGQNGSGKSTLLKLIALLDKPDKGRIVFDGGKVFRKKIGFLAQHPYLFDMSVFDNVALGLKLRKYPKVKINSRVNEILDILNIKHLAKRHVKFLSGGERQKAAIAQILVMEPQVILMDEPAAGVDKHSVAFIEKIIKDIHRRLKPLILLTTHSLSQADRISSRVVSLCGGKIYDRV